MIVASKTDKQLTGTRGEDLAAEYLLREGFMLLHRNWRSGHYELDIVATKNGTLHIVEVKCRKSMGLTTPEEAYTPQKFRSLSKAAASYIAQYAMDIDTQFDMVAVEYDTAGQEQIRYYPNVMYPRW